MKLYVGQRSIWEISWGMGSYSLPDTYMDSMLLKTSFISLSEVKQVGKDAGCWRNGMSQLNTARFEWNMQLEVKVANRRSRQETL